MKVKYMVEFEIRGWSSWEMNTPDSFQCAFFDDVYGKCVLFGEEIEEPYGKAPRCPSCLAAFPEVPGSAGDTNG